MLKPSVASIPNTEQSTLLDKYLDSIYCVLIAFLNELETGVYREEQQQLPRSPSTATQSPSATIKCRCFEERAKTIRVELESSLEIKNELEKYKQLVSERDQTIGAKTKTIDDLQWKIKKLEHRVAILEKEVPQFSTLLVWLCHLNSLPGKRAKRAE